VRLLAGYPGHVYYQDGASNKYLHVWPAGPSSSLKYLVWPDAWPVGREQEVGAGGRENVRLDAEYPGQVSSQHGKSMYGRQAHVRP
jgi:hypothetical protein